MTDKQITLLKDAGHGRWSILARYPNTPEGRNHAMRDLGTMSRGLGERTTLAVRDADGETIGTAGFRPASEGGF